MHARNDLLVRCGGGGYGVCGDDGSCGVCNNSDGYGGSGYGICGGNDGGCGVCVDGDGCGGGGSDGVAEYIVRLLHQYCYYYSHCYHHLHRSIRLGRLNCCTTGAENCDNATYGTLVGDDWKILLMLDNEDVLYITWESCLDRMLQRSAGGCQ
ncbi:uncharacterized protein LOC119654318 [Hermetia illucens]|uniref:uncharacterized protein LOC119654318 n=1 Tax=Hermetia illucens TaxID=343691 RepID=UPI0018CBF6C4|nr:uncharacterized protein LOC119654318 [Hermetia illucens]